MAENQRSSQLHELEHLRRYLPPELADAISSASHESALASYTLEAFVHLAAARYTLTTYLPRLLIDQVLEAQQTTPWLIERDGSLLFADLSGSTALAERLSALGREGTERVTDALNHIFSTLIAIIEHYGGDLLTFGGDALLVFFGGEGHSSSAAQAALALQTAMKDYAHEIAGVGSFPMHVHIGVESGSVTFASAGLAHTQYCFPLGPTVNQVAIAEALAPPGQIVIGPNAAAALAAAEGALLERGFRQLTQLHGIQQAQVALAEQAPITAPPEQAIPMLLDELHRFSPYIPRQLLAKILADPQRPEIEAELRPVTVVFAQVIGLEELLASHAPRNAAALLQTYIVAMQEAIELYGGGINKIDIADEGLKVIAIFGAPTAYEDHAERAALAALEMLQRIADCQSPIADSPGQAPTSNLQSPISIRIGLNLGTAFAGNVGSVSRKEYTVMGDAVNVAARVMSKATWGEIWCATAVSEATSARLVCEQRGAVALKGKAQPLELCQVLAARETAPDEFVLAAGPLIGRERELVWLREQLAAAKAQHGRAVQIVGDAGVGKSRLTAALVADARAAGFRVIPAACFSYTVGIPYAAWSDWLKACCGIVAGDSNAQRIHKLSAALAQLGSEMEEWLPILGDLVRLDIPENRLTRGLDPKMRQARRFELLEQLLLHAAGEQPVLVLFEDMHWADPISFELWQRIAAKLEGTNVLLVGIHRPGLIIGEQVPTHLLHLHELSAEESSAMIAALTGATELPEPVLKQIIGRAAGNPLFLSELIYAVTNRGSGAGDTSLNTNAARQHRDTGEHRTPNTEHRTADNLQSTISDLPDSLSGLLLARIDRLDETSRNVLRIASVIGQRIPFGVLRALQPQEQDVLVRQLLRLDAQELTAQERIEPERVHVFRHALIQEVAYQSMLYARRRDLHGRIGAYLERRYAGDLDDYIGLIAHHYRLSDRREKAITYLLKAGQAASAVYANAEAIQSLEWAIEAIGDDSDQRMWQARDALADVFSTIGRYEDARAQHSAIIGAPAVSADAAQCAHRKRGAVHEKQGQYAAALADLEHAMRIATSGDLAISPLAVPAICADIGLVHQRRGAYDQAIAACEEGLSGLDRDPKTHEDEQLEARIHSSLGGIYGMRGHYARSRQHFEYSLRIRELIDDLPGLSGVYNDIGYLWQLEGQQQHALKYYAMAEDIARKIHLHFILIFAGLNKAYAFINLGQYTHAVEISNRVLVISDEVNDRANAAQSYNTLGVAHFHIGNYDQALTAYEHALHINRQLGAVYQIANVQMNKAIVLNTIKHYDEAQALAQAAIDQAEALQAQRLKVEALNVLAEAQLGLGAYAAAQQHNQAALEAAESLSSHQDFGIALRIQGCILAALGQPFEQKFEESLQIFRKHAEQFELGRTLHIYGLALQQMNEADRASSLLKEAETTFISIGAHGERRKLAQSIAGSS